MKALGIVGPGPACGADSSFGASYMLAVTLPYMLAVTLRASCRSRPRGEFRIRSIAQRQQVHTSGEKCFLAHARARECKAGEEPSSRAVCLVAR
jgi:hypothetical protein